MFGPPERSKVPLFLSSARAMEGAAKNKGRRKRKRIFDYGIVAFVRRFPWRKLYSPAPRAACLCIVPVLVSISVPLYAQDEQKENELTPEQAQKVDLSGEKKESILPETPPEAPPPPPRKKGFVIESGLGALGWMVKFGTVAPPAYRLPAQLGYELFNWLMLFADGEIAF